MEAPCKLYLSLRINEICISDRRSRSNNGLIMKPNDGESYVRQTSRGRTAQRTAQDTARLPTDISSSAVCRRIVSSTICGVVSPEAHFLIEEYNCCNFVFIVICKVSMHFKFEREFFSRAHRSSCSRVMHPPWGVTPIIRLDPPPPPYTFGVTKRQPS